MKKLTAWLALALGIAVAQARAADAPALQVSPAEVALRDLVDRQQKIFAAAEKAGDNLDADNFRLQVQQLANSYDDYLKKYPDYPPAYTSYGVMLGRIDMRRESAAMFFRADTLFSNASRTEGARTPAFDRAWALTRNQLGNFVAEEGKPLEAVSLFLGAIDLVPDEPLYHYQLGKLLTAARDDFLKGGAWTRDTLDKAMNEAFRKAAELAPDRVEFVYRYAESFYDLEKPDWDAALKVWGKLEEKAGTDAERQTMRLHAANILIKQQKFDHARTLLASVGEPALQTQRQKLVAQLPADVAK